MYFDALTLAAIKDELKGLLEGGRVQRIVRPSELTLGLELYAGQRHQVLLSAETQSAGLYLSEEKLRRGTEAPSPLELLLRKYVRGARLTRIEQPPLERVLHLSFASGLGTVTLICEFMGRLSNLILVDEEALVLDAVKRVPSSVNRFRSILPQHPYVAPPPQQKQSPLTLPDITLAGLLAEREKKPLWRHLVELLAGVSPLVAREIAYRATGSTTLERALDSDDVAKLAQETLNLYKSLSSHIWSPCIGFADAETDLPNAFAPYELTHMAKMERIASISEGINQVREAQGQIDPYKQVRQRLSVLIDDQVGRQEGRMASLHESQAPQSKIDELELQGNIILAMSWSIQPGQAELIVSAADWGLEEEGEIKIALDATLSPSENAQRRFRRYHKLKAAADQVPQLLTETQMELDYLRQLRTEVRLAEDRNQLDDIEREMTEAGYLKKRRKRTTTAPSAPITVTSVDGMLILVGRNSRQNDQVTFRRGAPEDIWLHAHDVPGSHVILKCGGREIPQATLTQAAELAAFYSGSRSESRVQVDYCQRRYVRAIKGARPGMVTFTHEQTLVVAPRQYAE